MSHSTIAIFQHLVNQVSQYIPATLRQEIQTARKKMDEIKLVQEIEDVMITLGKKVWPYRKVFLEFLNVAKDSLGEHFFLSCLPRALHRNYRNFLERGGSWQHWHLGRELVQHFSPDERIQLSVSCITVNKNLQAYVVQQIKGVQEQLFINRVSEYQARLEIIEAELRALSLLAKQEENSQVVAEILSFARAVEYGFCLLGPEIGDEHILQARENFAGRKKERLYYQI